jgi:hypothetical protein
LTILHVLLLRGRFGKSLVCHFLPYSQISLWTVSPRPYHQVIREAFGKRVCISQRPRLGGRYETANF